MISAWWLLLGFPLFWGLGFVWASRAYLLGYERAKLDLLGDFR